MVADEARVQANVLHILSMVCHKDKAPTNALLAQAVRTCAEHGIRYLTYDRFAYGKKQGDSLSKFKETIGFRRVDIPRYYVPLTPLGKATLRLGLHHKLVERIPESVMFKLRELRSVWYARKLRISTDPC
jgi:hypothetical protein